MTFASTLPVPSAWHGLNLRGPKFAGWRSLALVTAFALAMCAEPALVPAAPPDCPLRFEAPTLALPSACPAPAAGVLYRPDAHVTAERLRVEHAAMDAAGNRCLDALDAARAERTRCYELAGARLEGVADLLRSQADGFDVVAAALAERPAPARHGWALVGAGGLVAGGAGIAAMAADASVVEAAGVTLGAAVLAAGITAVVQWVAGD